MVIACIIDIYSSDICVSIYNTRPVGSWGSREIARTPLFASKDFIHRPAIGIYSVHLVVSVPLASLPLRITALQMSLVAAMQPICSWNTS